MSACNSEAIRFFGSLGYDCLVGWHNFLDEKTRERPTGYTCPFIRTLKSVDLANIVLDELELRGIIKE